MGEILLFGGTVEGRKIAEYLHFNKIDTYVCVTTEYAKQLLPESEFIRTSTKPLDEDEIKELIEKNTFDLVLDATHPYAVVVSENIKNACKRTHIEYVRVLRSNEYNKDSNCIWVKDVSSAVEYLKHTDGNILVTTGSKEVKEFTSLANYENRCFVRVLPTIAVMEECIRLGFQGSHLICMQGPFNKELNLAMFKQLNVSYLVTKESGSNGGFEEKIEAALEAKVTPIVIGRPKEAFGDSMEAVIRRINKQYEIQQKRKVTLVGMGMGNKKTMTLDAISALKNCNAIIGSKRLLEEVSDFQKEIYDAIRNEDIVEYIRNHEEHQHIVVVFSGDIGFYSGAKRLRPCLTEYEVHAISGISAPVYFLNQLGVAWEDATLMSLHGKDQDIINKLRQSNKVFTLLGGDKNVSDICKELISNGFENVKITVGENLSYKEECITTGLTNELKDKIFSKMAVMLIERDTDLQADKKYIEDKKKVSYGMNDEAFIRGNTPMTKSEIRSISISKLQLTESSILYDIGAGTGSVAIETALLVKHGAVFAIEKKEDAVHLILENKRKFATENLFVYHAEASEIVEELPKPTHAFIGGSSGNLELILNQLLYKNKEIQIVLNVIALETLAEIISLLKRLPVKDVDIVQAFISKGKSVGDYQLMMGQNPVYIISFSGSGESNNEKYSY